MSQRLVTILAWYACLMSLVMSSTRWTYQEVRKSGKFCPERDSCSSQWRSQETEQLSWQSRNCFCDANCSQYGDCCIDAEKFDQNEQKENLHSFSCLPLKEYGLVYMRTVCSPDWPEDHVRSGCEDHSVSARDPVGTMPVTSARTGVTYSSYYCAVCNQDSVGAEFWKPRIECRTLENYSSRFSNVTKHFVRDNLKYNNDRGGWGVYVTSLGVTEFHPCDIAPYLPPTLAHHLRPCPAQHLNHTCPPGYPDTRVVELCQSYTGLVYGDARGRPFRNIHCALCNQVDTAGLICIKLEVLSRSSIFNSKFSTFSFAILFDINNADGEEVGVERRCSEQEIWDPFFRKCRNVVCGDGGQVLVGGKCYLEREVLELATTSVNSGGLSSTSASPKAVPVLHVKDASTKSSLITTSSTQTSLRSSNSSYPSSTIKPSLSVNVIKVIDEIDALFNTPRPKYPQKITARPDLYHQRPTSTSPSTGCPQVLLSSLEFKLQNGSVHVPAYSKTFPPGHFWPSGNSVYICQPSHTFTGAAKFSPMMGYVTTACLGLSIICLTFHLIISCIAPQLRNLSGKNLFSLSLALIGAYTTFLANMFTREISTFFCMILAVSMYYFFLAAFFWMLTIAFDVASTLKHATKDLRLTTGPQWGKFAIYSLVGWVFPGLLVSCAVIIDQMDFEEVPEIFKPGFGGSSIGLCWFSRRNALLVYFVIPFFVIMVLNIFFFISSAFLVWDTAKSSVKITTSGPKINFFLHLRLSVLMGLSWISGLVAGWLDIEPVWYVFLVLNTLQGLFILVFFTCSKKVVTSVKERLCGRSKEDYSWKKQPKDTENSVLSRRSSSMTVPGASLTGSGARPFKYSASSYDQYHQYDQRFYSSS